jgi:hypothetical protein
MARVMLVHWNAEEAAERAERLRTARHSVETVETFSDHEGGKEARRWRDDPPDAFVIDLARLPSHGCATAGYIRDVKALREKPIVFVAGEAENVARARRLLPDAVFADWSNIRSVLKEALANPPASPVRIQSTSGYSGTPLPKKLGIKPDSVVALLGAPDGFTKALGSLPRGVRVVTAARGPARTVVLFVRSAADLGKRFDAASRCMGVNGSALWLAWPKKTGPMASDLGENEVRAFGLARGFVDYKVCAIDQTWSGLCFARRKS